MNNQEIKSEIIKCIDNGMKNRDEIFVQVSINLGVETKLVKRCNGSLRQELIRKLEILGTKS